MLQLLHIATYVLGHLIILYMYSTYVSTYVANVHAEEKTAIHETDIYLYNAIFTTYYQKELFHWKSFAVTN